MKYCYLLGLLACCAAGMAQNDSIVPFEKAYKRVYRITKAEDKSRPVVDGRLDDEFWTKQGEWSEPFVQVTPFERVITPSLTKVKVLYDNKYIYVGIYCKDAVPEKMNRFVGNRDVNRIGDLVSVAFDTYHDYRVAPEFNINLGGNKTDLMVTDKLTINLSWNAVWEGRTHINWADSSWTAEMRIPFNQLRYNQTSGSDVWGFHVRRIIRRNNEVQNWSLIPLKNNGHVFSFGEIHGMTDLPKARGIEILPYIMGKYGKEPKIAGSPYQKGSFWGKNAGIDAKVALSDFTLDLTVNPDFGQVELDPSVMNLTAYETFYDEKRPFFLEGKHILDVQMGADMMFYTRRIGSVPSLSPAGINNETDFSETISNVPIIGALKLTGTNRQGVTLGIVQSLTARSSAKVMRNGVENSETLEPLTNYSVARIQKNWKGNTLLGGMITSVNRVFNDPNIPDNTSGTSIKIADYMVRNAYTAGIDFMQFFSNRLYYVDMKGMYSSLNGSKEAITRLQKDAVHYYQRTSAADYLGVDEKRTALNGTGGYLKIGRKGNAKWAFSEQFSWLSPGFDLNDAGFLKQADLLSTETMVEFRQTNTWKKFRNNTLTLSQTNRWDYSKKSFGNSLLTGWKTMFLNRYEVNITQTYGWNKVDNRRLRGGPDIRLGESYTFDATFNTDRAERFMFMMQFTGDYQLQGDYSLNTLSPSFTLRLGNHIYLTSKLNYAHNLDAFQYVATIPPPTLSTPVYMVGKMEQQTFGLTMNLQVNITPDVSIQWNGAPFTSIAKFDRFKKAMRPESSIRNDRFHQFLSNEIRYADNRYTVNDGLMEYSFSNPDFNFNEFRSNLVARWEYRPGSTLYFVWEHSMSNREGAFLSGWNSNLERMFALPSRNIFMLKLNYFLNW